MIIIIFPIRPFYKDSQQFRSQYSSKYLQFLSEKAVFSSHKLMSTFGEELRFSSEGKLNA